MGKKYVPSPAPADTRVECRHHVALIQCPKCNRK